jgi:hypothetical protein
MSTLLRTTPRETGSPAWCHRTGDDRIDDEFDQCCAALTHPSERPGRFPGRCTLPGWIVDCTTVVVLSVCPRRRVLQILALIVAVHSVSWPAAAATPDESSETRWIVNSVTAWLVRLAPATRSRPAALPAVPAGAPVWDPVTYARVAATLFRTSRPRPAVRDHNVRAPLVTPTTEVLLAESARLGSVLARTPASASAHESAALLVGALAMQESPDFFGDVRPALARITAHLAAADALRDPDQPTLDGALARIVLLTLIGHQEAAVRGLDGMALRLTGPAERAWERALRLRITGNWREYPAGEDGSLLERLEEARALNDRLGNEAFEAALGTLVQEDVVAWDRLVVASVFSVGAGRAIVDAAEDRARADAFRVWQALHPEQARPADLTSELNAGTQRPHPVSMRRERDAAVLDWPLWAGFQQRQLLTVVEGRHRLLEKLGYVQPDPEPAFVREVQERYAGLALYPVLLRRMAGNDAERDRAVSLGRQLADTAPHLITAAAWRLLATDLGSGSSAQPFPSAEAWFVDAVPPGSAFDLRSRALRSGVRPPTTTQLGQWAAARPFDWRLQRTHQQRLAANGRPADVDVRTAIAPVLGYDLFALRYLVTGLRLNRADRHALYKQLCEVSFAGCRDLADYLVREGRDTDAAVAYERWMEATPDAVAAANDSAWLVRYYLRTGQAARAEARAREAGDAYSNRGLQVLGHYLDARGREAEAELVYEAIRNRYDNTVPLGTFTVRKALRRADEVLQHRGWNLLKSVFPNGGERLAWETLTGPPADGVVFATFGRRAEARGLRRDDVIVGVDEWRVRKARQYAVLADLRHDETMTFTVWRDGRYEQIHAVVRERWLGMELDDYEPPPTNPD